MPVHEAETSIRPNGDVCQADLNAVSFMEIQILFQFPKLAISCDILPDLLILRTNSVAFMRIDILSVVPELLDSPLSYSIVGRAVKKGLVEIHVHNIRKHGIGSRQTVDDYCYGGDAGMVMMVEPVFKMINELTAERHYDEIIYMSPDGEQLTQGISNELSLKENIIILCGHYKGIDERIREHLITREISVGDYVVSGGEIPAALLTDSLVRLIPGALTDETSALSDSFQDGLVSPPVYTRPSEFNGWKVPDVLLSGNPKLIQEWQMQQALERTKKLRPYLLEDNPEK